MINWRAAIDAGGGPTAMLHGKQLALVIRALEEFETLVKESAERSVRQLAAQRELESRLNAARSEAAVERARAEVAGANGTVACLRSERLEALLTVVVYCREAVGMPAPVSEAIDAILEPAA